MEQKQLHLKTSNTINAEEDVIKLATSIVENELEQQYNDLFKDIPKFKLPILSKIAEEISSVQPMDGDLFKNLFNAAKKRDEKLKELGIKPKHHCISDYIQGVKPMTDEEYK